MINVLRGKLQWETGLNEEDASVICPHFLPSTLASCHATSQGVKNKKYGIEQVCSGSRSPNPRGMGEGGGSNALILSILPGLRRVLKYVTSGR